MKKLITTGLLLILAQFNLHAQGDFGYRLNFTAAMNGLAVPSRLNTINGSDQSFEPMTAYTAGVVGRMAISPITSDYFFYTYRNEFSVGMGYRTTHHYQIWGHEVGLGYKTVFLTLRYQNRFLNSAGYFPDAQNANTVEEFTNYSKYQDITRTAIGLQIQLSQEDQMNFGYIMENAEFQYDGEPWQGAYISWNAWNSWGVYLEGFWNHPAYGYTFVDQSAVPDDLPQTSFFVNLKLEYSIDIGNSYDHLLRHF